MRREDTHTYVVRTEHLEDDLHGLFAWLCTSPVATVAEPIAAHVDYPGSNDTELSGRLGTRVALMVATTA